MGLEYMAGIQKANDNKAQEIPMRKDTETLAMGISGIKTIRKSWLQRWKERRLYRRMARHSEQFVITPYQDRLIVADNRDRKIYALTPAPLGPWDMELIATF